MQNSITLLKSRRNELSPAVNIPDEILLEIFLIMRDGACRSTPHEWFPTIQICRHWRRVSVGSPSLWTYIHSSSPALVPLMLQRSKKAPLDVSFSGTPITILHEIERIRILDLTAPRGVLEASQAMLMHLGREATLLEELTIRGDHNDRPIFTPDAFRPTRTLRKLSLMSVQYHWDSLRFPNLTHLTLNGREAPTAVSGNRFTDALRQMQRFVHLSI